MPKATIPEKWLSPTNSEVYRQRFEFTNIVADCRYQESKGGQVDRLLRIARIQALQMDHWSRFDLLPRQDRLLPCLLPLRSQPP